MKYRLLGRTGLYVSEMCLGAMTFGGDGFWKVMGGLGQATVNELVKQAYGAGINFIDTANVYSLGQSETRVGQAIKDLGLPRNELVIATKATGIMNELPNGRGQSRYHLMNELDASLQRLQLDHIDLYQLHEFDFPVVDKDRAFSCVDAMRPIAEKRGVSIAQIALAWLLAQPAVSSVIIGAKTVQQLRDNIEAGQLCLAQDELAVLNDVSQLPAEYPGWMLEMQGKYREAQPTRN